MDNKWIPISERLPEVDKMQSNERSDWMNEKTTGKSTYPKMSNRTKATSIPKKVREEVYQRDKCCIICGSPNGVPNAHLVPRSQSGLGIKENVVTLCNLCHHEMDNGKNTIEVTQKVREYLEKLYPEVTDEMRKYNKWRNEE